MFRLGTGQVPFMDELFHIRDRYVPLSVQSLHLSSANVNKKVEWQFDRDQGKSNVSDMSDLEHGPGLTYLGPFGFHRLVWINHKPGLVKTPGIVPAKGILTHV